MTKLSQTQIKTDASNEEPGQLLQRISGKGTYRHLQAQQLAKSSQIALSVSGQAPAYDRNIRFVTFCYFWSMVFINVQLHNLYPLVILGLRLSVWSGSVGWLVSTHCPLIKKPYDTSLTALAAPLPPCTVKTTTTPPHLPYIAGS